jgi:hypothetical protein
MGGSFPVICNENQCENNNPPFGPKLNFIARRDRFLRLTTASLLCVEDAGSALRAGIRGVPPDAWSSCPVR